MGSLITNTRIERARQRLQRRKFLAGRHHRRKPVDRPAAPATFPVSNIHRMTSKVGADLPDNVAIAPPISA
jgi:hypothetical protein